MVVKSRVMNLIRGIPFFVSFSLDLAIHTIAHRKLTLRGYLFKNISYINVFIHTYIMIYIYILITLFITSVYFYIINIQKWRKYFHFKIIVVRAFVYHIDNWKPADFVVIIIII